MTWGLTLSACQFPTIPYMWSHLHRHAPNTCSCKTPSLSICLPSAGGFSIASAWLYQTTEPQSAHMLLCASVFLAYTEFLGLLLFTKSL